MRLWAKPRQAESAWRDSEGRLPGQFGVAPAIRRLDDLPLSWATAGQGVKINPESVHVPFRVLPVAAPPVLVIDIYGYRVGMAATTKSIGWLNVKVPVLLGVVAY